jgi:putative tryptophan/tyrosine transport system substrate-binding protein
MLAVLPLVCVQAVAQPVVSCRVAWVSMDEAGANSPLLAAFRAGMADLGYVEGKNLVIDTWWGGGSSERLEQMAGDILRARPDVIVTQGGSALPPMLQAGVKKPIVFSMSADPVEAKIVDSYAHPGGNVTGITLFATDLAGKRMALLAEVLPGVKRFALVANPQHPGEQKEVQGAQAAAAKLGFTLRYFPVQTEAELDAALAEIARARIEAIMVLSDGFAVGYAERFATFSAQNRIPVVTGWAQFAHRGNLITYGPVFADVYRRLATYVDRIHKGARPGDLPVEQPTKLELVINLKTAKALGLTIPQSLLLRADEVIQ